MVCSGGNPGDRMECLSIAGNTHARYREPTEESVGSAWFPKNTQTFKAQCDVILTILIPDHKRGLFNQNRKSVYYLYSPNF